MAKRIFDLVMSAFGLIVFFPLLAATAIWIKLDSPGPVFYRGLRAGRHGKSFKIYKFRSMVTNADKIGGPSTSGDDPRVTASGRFLRKLKLDELSQLINVLCGDMSFVGPRPEVVDKAAELDGQYLKIMAVRPGITDWASIWNSDEGGVLAGVPDADLAYEEVIRPTKLKLQLYYCENAGFWVDLKIIALTLLRIFSKNTVPAVLNGYPSFDAMRAEVLRRFGDTDVGDRDVGDRDVGGTDVDDTEAKTIDTVEQSWAA